MTHQPRPGRPSVSVVIPAYNAQAYLGECLASVLAQDGGFVVETIVVDDGSTDSTVETARHVPGVVCLQQAHRGPSAARNAGVAAARGEWISFLDADDVWPPGKLVAQFDVLARHPDAALVFGDCRQADAAMQPYSRTEFQAGRLGSAAWGESGWVPDAYMRLLEDNFITTGSVLMRRDVHQALGGFAEELRLVEDLDLWLRVAQRYRIAWCGEVCLLRRRHPASASRDAEAMALAYLEVLRRQGEPAHAVVARLQARELLHLADLALARADRRTATLRAWHSFRLRPGWRAAWTMAAALAAGSRLRSGKRAGDER